MSDQAIIPIEQKEIEFYEDKVTAVVAPDGTVYVPVRPLCDLIGVDWGGQYQRIKRDEILNDVSISVVVTPTQIETGRGKLKSRDMIALPLDYLNGWLFGMNPSRVNEAVRPSLLRYQRECYKVLSEAFTTGVGVRPDSDIMQSTDEAAVTFRTLVQLARIAREHYYLTKRVDEHDEQLADHAKQIGLIQAQLSNPAAYVTQEQAQLISSGVKAIATHLGKVSGRNEFGAVYGELYQRYGVTSYKHIATSRYDDVIKWLREWWKELSDSTTDTPF